MSQLGIIVNVDKCIGCQACFVACKEENKVAPGIQWNQIHRAENLQDRIINYFRVSCQHCDNPACLPVCPAKAIYKGPHGEVLVDQSKCREFKFTDNLVIIQFLIVLIIWMGIVCLHGMMQSTENLGI